MNIGIIGAGMVGGALTKAFAKRGRAVVVASTDPTSAKTQSLIKEAGDNACAASAQDAVDHGEVVILATPWPATEAILASLLRLDGKVLIDATNPIRPDFSGLEIDKQSGGEKVAGWAPGARVVKTLNQIGFEMMDAPKLAAGAPVMFVAGDDAPAKKTVCDLVASLGFDADDCGGLDMARHLESLAWIWINRAMKQGKARAFGFVLSDAAEA
ncbi:MAG: NADPH-dependent F420 reductase [Pseudomonadota bacterium]